MLPDISIERLDLFERKPTWSEIKIANMPKLASFGFSYDNHTERLFIVGGTDGSILHTEWWQVDLKNLTVEDLLVE